MAPTPGPVPGPIGQIDERSFLMSPRATTSTKGLLNKPGQNNCFLNSAVQVLWHLDAFRRTFRQLSGHACMAESCIFCALKELFTQFQYSKESALPPDALRQALAKTFCDQRRFQLGFMDDAAECFENILLRIHVHTANQDSDDMCTSSQCIPHQKFAMTLVEQRMCQNCSAASEPLPFTQMVHYVTTSALCAKAVELQQDPNNALSSFGDLLRLAGEMGEIRDCQSGCGCKVHATKTLMNHPEVVSIGLVWDSESPSLQHITDVFHSIAMHLRLKDVFHDVLDTEWSNNATHRLVGVVTYYGKHYSTFFFHTKLGVWIYFDDATVREIGPSWEQVVEKCQRGRFQPLLLLFATPDNASEIIKKDGFSYANQYKTPVNQRQSVINQYLAFRNSKKFQYQTDPCLKSYTNEPPIYQNHQVLSSGNGYAANIALNFDREQTLPTYSNLPHLNSIQNHLKSVDVTVPSYQQQGLSIKYNKVPSSSDITMLSNSSQQQNINKSYNTSGVDSITPIAQQLMEQMDISPIPLNPHQQNITYKQMQQHHLMTGKQHNLASNHQITEDMTKDSDSAFTEDDDMYISRKAVENVLKLQKRQLSLSRCYSQTVIGSRHSSSSLESFDHVQNVKMNQVVVAPQVEMTSNRRDSGSWSSDRNSSSSNNSVENPFLTVVASKRLLLGLNKKTLSDASSTNTSDHGYDSFSISSSDSYPSVNGSPVKVEPRLTQIPEDWQPEEDQQDLDKKLKLITEGTSAGPPDCDKLCAEADLLLAKSFEKEKDGDLVMAALLSDSAAARARAAMEAPYNNSKSLVKAKMKHSTCVMRSTNLYRRIKDHELEERRKQKNHTTGHHSRQNSRDSTHSRHSRQSSKDNSHSKSGSKESNLNTNSNSEEPENFGKNIEIYGTLPKKGSRKKPVVSNTVKGKDDQVYKDFLDKQRKNTSLASALSETSIKNVDLPPTPPDPSPKRKDKGSSQQSIKNNETTPPKSPTRKKDHTQKQEVDVKKRVSKQQQQIVQSSANNNKNEFGFNSQDLLTPIPTPDKKQHKIKRKLMGGFMKRKNRSLPDLREDQTAGEPIDCFMDDAIIPVPSVILPSGKTKKVDQIDGGSGNVSRGFHQPHHAFVKKDLTQRPLLMKVNPPNVQSSVLSSPKLKPSNTLPSLPKKPAEMSPKPEVNYSSKPSKIPFMTSPVQKMDATISQQITSYKTIKPNSQNKTSAIPVLTPNVQLSPIKSPKANFAPTEITIGSDRDELPMPTSPLMAELQMKRKQILEKPQDHQKQMMVESPTCKDLTILPKLAAQAEGSSWLQELQNKQKQILSKPQNATVVKPEALPEKELKPTEVQVQEMPKSQNKIMLGNWKLIVDNGTELQATSYKNSSSSLNSPIATNKFPTNSDSQPISFQQTQNLESTHTTASCSTKHTLADVVHDGRNHPGNRNSTSLIDCVDSKEVIKFSSEHLRTPNSIDGDICANSLTNDIKVTGSYSVITPHPTNPVNTDGKPSTLVKNIATRFEKVLKIDPAVMSTGMLSINSHNPSDNQCKLSRGIASNKLEQLNSSSREAEEVVPPLKSALKRCSSSNESQSSWSAQTEGAKIEILSAPNVIKSNTPSLKSALKRTNSNQDDASHVTKPDNLKPALKQSSPAPDQTNASSQRPMCPPDYATAMQRLEQLKNKVNDCAPQKLGSESQAREQATKNKKTVTFSDEVVLVACAEYDEIDFSSNPLFERVYQQHVDSGKGVIPILSSCYGNHQSSNDVRTMMNVKDSDHEAVPNQIASCNLCHNKQVSPPKNYCEDCEFYLSRFKA